MWKKKSALALAALLVALGAGFTAQRLEAQGGEAGATCTCEGEKGAHEGEGTHGGKGDGRRGGHGGHGGHSGRGGHGGHGDMASAHALLARHDQIQRRVVERPDGVETWTTSDDPEVAKLLGTHVRQMKERLASGRPVRPHDPLFRAIFDNHDKIRMEIEDVDGGVRVVETSDDPKVVQLIQAHARLVDGFVEEGMARMHRGTSLPEGYAP